MSFFLRKAFRFGPLRLNLSKRGVGGSLGVKGLRAGVDASGKPYVAGGREGLYFRERLKTGNGSPSWRSRFGWLVAALAFLAGWCRCSGRRGAKQ